MAAVRTGWWTRNTLPWGDHGVVLLAPPAVAVAVALAPTTALTLPAPPAAAGAAVAPAPVLSVAAPTPAAAATATVPAPAMTLAVTAPPAVAAAVTPTPGVQTDNDVVAPAPSAVAEATAPAPSVTVQSPAPAAVAAAVTPSPSTSVVLTAAPPAVATAVAPAPPAAKLSITYTSFPTVPAGTTNVTITSGAGAVQASSNTLQEGNCLASNGTYYSAAVLPDVMATDLFSVEVTVGALSGAAADRGVGPGIFSADGTVGVATVWQASSSTAIIRSWSGGSFTNQASLGSQSANTGDVIKLVPSVSAGVVTWTVHKNGTPTGLSWTDGSHLVDLPGRHPGMAFRRAYNFGQYPSRGISALSAADL